MLFAYIMIAEHINIYYWYQTFPHHQMMGQAFLVHTPM